MNSLRHFLSGIGKRTIAPVIFVVLIVLQAITGGIAHAQSYSETILHSFANTPDGAYPADDVFLADAQGNVYGTTQIGGVSGNGTVFKVAPSGSATILHSFTGEDGQWPVAGVVFGEHGKLYGTTGNGGKYGGGVVFKLAPNGKESLYSFSGGADGFSPITSLILGASGNLYGTTLWGKFGVLIGLRNRVQIGLCWQLDRALRLHRFKRRRVSVVSPRGRLGGQPVRHYYLRGKSCLQLNESDSRLWNAIQT